MDFVSVDPPRAMSVTAEALVTDVNRQAWASSTSLVVHPSTLYVGLRSDRQFVQAGEDLELDAIVSDIDGELRSGVPIRVRVVRVEQRQDHGEWVEEELDEQLCERDSGTEPVRCTLTMKQGGSHRIEAEVVDAKGRLNRTVLTTWVAGGELPTEAGTTHEQVLLIPDREQYEAGQTARISVSAPWAPAEALITINRSGVVEERTIHLDTSSTTVEVPIEGPLVAYLHEEQGPEGAHGRAALGTQSGNDGLRELLNTLGELLTSVYVKNNLLGSHVSASLPESISSGAGVQTECQRATHPSCAGRGHK